MTILTETLQQQGWQNSEDGTAIHKTFRFDSFRQAMVFMLQVSYEAEAIDHHPDWLNVYNRVEVKLTTHDRKALTEKDIRLAVYMEQCIKHA